jgi:hypothetical protein
MIIPVAFVLQSSGGARKKKTELLERILIWWLGGDEEVPSPIDNLFVRCLHAFPTRWRQFSYLRSLQDICYPLEWQNMFFLIGFLAPPTSNRQESLFLIQYST